MRICDHCGQVIKPHIPAQARIDDTTRKWLKHHGYSYSYMNAVTRHLFGADLGEALDRLKAVHITPYGKTPQAARREIARMLDSAERFATVAHLFQGDT